LGVELGAFLALVGSFFYLAWTLWRARQATKAAHAAILSSALKKLNKK
jgi:predicted negative regulator of RcsB-dependent stress response